MHPKTGREQRFDFFHQFQFATTLFRDFLNNRKKPSKLLGLSRRSGIRDIWFKLDQTRPKLDLIAHRGVDACHHPIARRSQ